MHWLPGAMFIALGTIAVGVIADGLEAGADAASVGLARPHAVAASRPVIPAQVRQSNPFITGTPGQVPRPGPPPRVGQPPKRFFIAPGDGDRNRKSDPPNKFYVTPKTPENYYKASPAYRYGCYDPCRRAGHSPAACERQCSVNRR